eukprot:1174538-Prorocentrum_minimum.AAC.1
MMKQNWVNMFATMLDKATKGKGSASSSKSAGGGKQIVEESDESEEDEDEDEEEEEEESEDESDQTHERESYGKRPVVPRPSTGSAPMVGAHAGSTPTVGAQAQQASAPAKLVFLLENLTSTIPDQDPEYIPMEVISDISLQAFQDEVHTALDLHKAQVLSFKMSVELRGKTATLHAVNESSWNGMKLRLRLEDDAVVQVSAKVPRAAAVPEGVVLPNQRRVQKNTQHARALSDAMG